jgi:predicted phosphodiesterase
MASVRILHASDLHIAEQENVTSPVDRFTPGTIRDAVVNRMLASSHNSSVLLHLAKFAYQQAQSGLLDAVLLTGDIATTGSAADLQRALDFVHAPVQVGLGWLTRSREPSLSEVNAPIYLLPGNHDRFVAKPYGYVPGGTQFDVVFKDHWDGPVQTYPLLIKADVTLAIVGADFNLLNSDDADRWFGSLAQGMVYPKILNELERQTKALPDYARRCVIWAVHFPPAYPGVSPYLQLLEEDSLIQRANGCGVKAILAGHTHDAVKYRRPKMKFDVYCAGTASQAFSPEGNHFRVIEVATDDAGTINIKSEEYRFNRVQGELIFGRSGFDKV